MKKISYLTFALSAGLLFSGCSTPQVSTHGQVGLDEEVIQGGVGSNEIRTVADKMCPAILSLPEIDGMRTARIAVSPMKNSSRFIVDNNIFMKKLRLELNRSGKGKLRFFSQGNAQDTRYKVIENRRDDQVAERLDALAEEFVKSHLVSSSKEPVKMALLPVLNTNFVHMNADSFAAMLRSRIVEKSKGKVVFTMPGTAKGADYLMTGQFIADSMKTEGIVNMADYIKFMDKRIANNQSLRLYDRDNKLNFTNTNDNVEANTILKQIQLAAELRLKPNVNKKFNLIVVNAQSQMSVFEKMINIDKKFTDGTGNANFILSGEITSLSKKQDDKLVDYLLITMQLVNPDTNELIWEDGYEVKKSTVSGVVYQ